MEYLDTTCLDSWRIARRCPHTLPAPRAFGLEEGLRCYRWRKMSEHQEIPRWRASGALLDGCSFEYALVN